MGSPGAGAGSPRKGSKVGQAWGRDEVDCRESRKREKVALVGKEEEEKAVTRGKSEA